jgi:hypothetical protein
MKERVGIHELHCECANSVANPMPYRGDKIPHSKGTGRLIPPAPVNLNVAMVGHELLQHEPVFHKVAEECDTIFQRLAKLKPLQNRSIRASVKILIKKTVAIDENSLYYQTCSLVREFYN